MKFGCFQFIDAGQNVGVPINGVDAIAFSGGDEREMNRNGLGPFIGAGKQAVFPHENPTFDCSFGLIVVDRDVRVFEKSCQSAPMIETVINCFHQIVCGIELGFCAYDDASKQLHQRFRLPAPHCQPEGCRTVLNVLFNFVEFGVDFEHECANLVLGDGFKVFSSVVSAAARFDSLFVCEQSVESAGSVGLNDSAVVFEEGKIFVKRQIRREVEDIDWMPSITDVSRYLAFAHIVFVSAILNFDRGIVGFDDGGSKQIFFHQIVQKSECVCGTLHPIALSGARDCDVVASEDFFLAMVGKSVVEFADDHFTEQSRTCVAARNGWAWFFCCNDVLLTFRAGASFLAVVEYLQAGANHFQLLCKKVAHEDSFDYAIGTNRIFRLDAMHDLLVRNVLGVFEDMFNAGRFFAAIGCRRWLSWSLGSESGTRIMFFRLLPVFAFVPFFGLRDQYIEPVLHVREQLAQFFVALERLLKLLLKVFDHGCEPLDFLLVLSTLFSQKLFVVFF